MEKQTPLEQMVADELVTLSATVRREHVRRLQALAGARDVSVSALVREAVREWLARQQG